MNQITDTTSFSPLADEAMFEEELEAFIGRCRYGRGYAVQKGYRHGHRER